ncbi:MAG TPA: hypothetical protein VFH30_08695 [Acidimicrobiales bacterium]|nr:hypothetical protein [Acidimicrobiales bacterium]
MGFTAPLRDGLTSQPLFVTQRMTGGLDAGHLDVSLWYVCDADASRPVEFDPREFRAVRWWRFDELAGVDAGRFDPNLPRFLEKLLSRLDDRR